MTIGEPMVRLPKEATCDVECAMKVESLRMINKKRKQSQRADTNGGIPSGAPPGKRPFSPTEWGSDPGRGLSAPTHGSFPGQSPSLSRGSSAGGSSNGKDKDLQQRKRFVWSEPLHQDFVAAVFDIGLKCASPKLLLEMMPVVDGLTSEHIKSHLQKYRLHRQRSREEFLKSYGYLTDLDANKGLGGGSAAATIKAAVAAAGGQHNTSETTGESIKAETCKASCGCNDNDKSESKETPTSTNEQKQQNAPADASAMENTLGATDIGQSRQVSPETRPEGGNLERNEVDSPGAPHESETSVKHAANITQEMLREAARKRALPRNADGLLQTHLRLLAKGINMQIEFHRHLQQVVDSQRTLQLDLLQAHGQLSPPPVSTMSAVPGSTWSNTSPASSVASAANRIAGGSIAERGLGQPGGRRAWWAPKGHPSASEGIGPTTSGAIPVGPEEYAQLRATRSPNVLQSRRRGITERPGPKVFPFDAVAPKTKEERAGNFMLSNASDTSLTPCTAVVEPRENSSEVPSRHMNVTAARTAMSMNRDAAGVTRARYVPGEYTLTSKNASDSADGVAARGGAIATSMSGAGIPSAMTPRAVSDTRIADVASHLLQGAARSSLGQDTVALQRHMQAQMEMQRSMLEARGDQATLFGAQRAAHEGDAGNTRNMSRDQVSFPTNGSALTCPTGVSSEHNGQNTPHSEAAGAGAAPVPKDDASNVQAPHAQEPTESNVFMSLLHDDEEFDAINWLERTEANKSETRAPQTVPSAHPVVEDHLFSFLME